jgi:hypothetical protein
MLMTSVDAQCKINSKVNPDGSMSYSIKPILVYKTADKELKGRVVTDNENFFISLLPTPFPPKPGGLKLRGDIQVKLANQKTYKLKQYDSRYSGADTIFEMMYLIDRKSINDFQENEIDQVTLNMGKDEPERIYNLKLHKSAIQEQLACLRDKRNF